jgi:hypothetical protein
MKAYKTILVLLLLLSLPFLSFGQLTPQGAVKGMMRGINIGNTMEPETEGTWGNPPVKERAFDDYKNAGFTAVRIPITWDKHTAAKSPYTITKSWLDRVEQVVDWGLKRHLLIIINAHHEGWIKNNYSADNIARFDSIWSQIANRFKNKSDSLIFEIINEPYPITQANIDDLNARTLKTIRKTNPTRIVSFSGNSYSNSGELLAAKIPDTSDKYLIGYYHSYDPYPFGLVGPGTYGTDADKAATKAKFDDVTNWSVKNNIPVILDEYGYMKLCEYNSRMCAYATVVDQALRHGVAPFAWDDNGDFPIYYDRTKGLFNEIKDILINTYIESPAKLKISQPVSNRVILEWTNRTSNNDSIIIERKKSINGTFAAYAKVVPAMNSFTDTAVTLGEVYYYRLRTNIKDSIYPMSYPISISQPYFTKENIDTTVKDTFTINLFKATDPDIADVITYKLSLDNGSRVPAWIKFDPTKAILKNDSLKKPQGGVYKIVLTAKDRAGQIVTDTFTLTVDLPISLIKNHANNYGLIVYPNPANNGLNVSWPQMKGNIGLSVTDLFGREVLMKKFENLENQTGCNLNIANIPSGVYILKLNNNSSIITKKIYVNK